LHEGNSITLKARSYLNVCNSLAVTRKAQGSRPPGRLLIHRVFLAFACIPANNDFALEPASTTSHWMTRQPEIAKTERI